MLNDFDSDELSRIQSLFVQRVLGRCFFARGQVNFTKRALAELPHRAPKLLLHLRPMANDDVLCVVILSNMVFLVCDTAVACIAGRRCRQASRNLRRDNTPLRGEILLATQALLHGCVTFGRNIADRNISRPMVVYGIRRVLADTAIAFTSCFIVVMGL